MLNGRKIIATVCARGGSKGVKNKNIRPLGGKPMICYSLDLIRKSGIVDDYIVSTDSKDIMKAVTDYGFEIHFERPQELAGDKVSRLDVIRHAVRWAEKEWNKKYDIAADLGVATPLKSAEDLDNSIRLLVDKGAGNVFSVTPSSRSPYYNMVEVIEGKVSLVKSREHYTDRRDVPQVYDMNDGLNVWERDILFSENPQFNERTQIYVMPRERSVDIDEEIDFLFAEYLVTRGGNKE
jgi:CMP-N,N'-diacetyllegionaminic acid synthase